MKKILIINVNWLGDVLLSTASIRAVKKAFPESYLACMVPSRCVEVLKDNPNLDEIIVFDEKATHKGLIAKIKFIKELKKKRFDIVFLFHRSFTRALMVFLAGIPERVGYFTKKRGRLLTKKIAPPEEEMHRLNYYLNIVESYGIKSDGRYYEFFISGNDREYIDSQLKKLAIEKNDFVVVINPGGNWQPKRWPKEKFAELSDRLINELGAKIIISGSDKDITLADEISALMNTKPIILAGKTNLKQLGALMETADLVISADSGPMHIAAAMGTDLITLFGPTKASLTGPLGKGRIITIQKEIGCKIPCYEISCKNNRCMEAIDVEYVFKEVKRFR